MSRPSPLLPCPRRTLDRATLLRMASIFPWSVFPESLERVRESWGADTTPGESGDTHPRRLPRALGDLLPRRVGLGDSFQRRGFP